MRSNRGGVLLSAFLALSLVAGEGIAGGLDEVRQAGVLRVAVYQDFPPYSQLVGGTMQGVDVDIARALAERLGVGLSTMNLVASDEAMSDDLRNAVWKGHYLGGGTADVMLHVPVDEVFAADNDKVAIFGPYFREEIAIAHDPERLPQVDSLEPFTEARIAVELETIQDLYMSRAEGGRLVENVVHFRHVNDACDAFKAGETAAFIASRAQLEACIGADRERFMISSVPAAQRVALFSWTVGMAVKADNTALKEALDDAMTTLRDDGTLQAIFAQHGLTYLAPAARQGA